MNLTVMCPLEGSDLIRTSKLLCIKGIMKLPFVRFNLLKIRYENLGPSGMRECCWVPKFLLPKAVMQIGLFGHLESGKGNGQINENGTSKLEKP